PPDVPPDRPPHGPPSGPQRRQGRLEGVEDRDQAERHVEDETAQRTQPFGSSFAESSPISRSRSSLAARRRRHDLSSWQGRDKLRCRARRRPPVSSYAKA